MSYGGGSYGGSRGGGGYSGGGGYGNGASGGGYSNGYVKSSPKADDEGSNAAFHVIMDSEP